MTFSSYFIKGVGIIKNIIIFWISRLQASIKQYNSNNVQMNDNRGYNYLAEDGRNMQMVATGSGRDGRTAGTGWADLEEGGRIWQRGGSVTVPRGTE